MRCSLLFACVLTLASSLRFDIDPSPFPAASLNDDAALLETGSPSKLTVPPTSDELKIVSYNIRWRSGEELHEIIERLRSDAEVGGAQIIGLQEVDRRKRRTGYTNTARLIAEGLGMNYAWAAPPQSEDSTEEETGVALFSPYPLTEISRIVLPHPGPRGRQRVALGATIKIAPDRAVRVYTVHSETRIEVWQKIDQLRAVLDDLKRYPQITRYIVLGDFNTTEVAALKETRRLFAQAGFLTPFDEDQPTWRFTAMGLKLLELKLDWIWLHGLSPQAWGIARRINYSDHWPLWIRAKFD
jgi:endonuclease/exonuclease/phosphatase family metal-dependent hydrolase